MYSDLHIVAFNVPLPANYGGVMDVFYRIKALYEAGVRIHLHCFTYGRPEVEELKNYCVEVNYYRRNMSPLLLLDRRPFIVSSRDNRELRRRLASDNYPILLEGLHCCSVLEDEGLQKGRVLMVRAHNVEADYYAQLAAAEQSPFRKTYLKLEARRIGRYEPILKRASAVLAISQGDKKELESMGCGNVLLVGGSHPYNSVVSLTGRGTYALYHGNLSVAENYNAVNYLLDNVFNGEYPLVVAGNEPPAWLSEKIEHMDNISLAVNPDDGKMKQLMAEAQVNILITSQPTGLKLKLLNALFAGRHCLVNSAMVQGTGLADLCYVADDATRMRQVLGQLMATDFTEEQVERRGASLEHYTTAHAIEPILEILER